MAVRWSAPCNAPILGVMFVLASLYLALQVSPSIAVDAVTPGRVVARAPALGYCDGYFLTLTKSPSYDDRSLWYGRLRASDGALVDVPFRTVKATVLASEAIAIGCDGKNFVLAYTMAQGNGTPSGVSVVRIRASDGAIIPAPGGADALQIADISGGDLGRTPAVACGGGAIFVAWAEPRYDGLTDDLYGARIRASDGVLLDGPIRNGGITISTAMGNQKTPAVIFTGEHFLVAWIDGRNGSTDIYAARVRANDGMLMDGPPATGGIEVVRTPARPYNTRSGLQVAGDGVQALFTWYENSLTLPEIGAYGVRLRVADASLLDGPASAGGVPILTRGMREQNAVDLPAVAYAGGNFLVSTRTLAMRVAADMKLLDGAASSGGLSAAGGAIASDGSTFLLGRQVYSEDSSPQWVEGTRVRASTGEVLDKSASLALLGQAKSWQGLSQVACGKETCLVIWTDERVTEPGLYGVRVRKRDGALLDRPARRISTARPPGTPLPNGTRLGVTAFDGSSYVVAWPRDGAIRGNRLRESDGTLLDGEGVELTASTGQTASIGCVTGTCLVAWNDVPNLAKGVRARRWKTGDGTLLDPSPLDLGIGLLPRYGNGAVTAGKDGFLVLVTGRQTGPLARTDAVLVRAADATLVRASGPIVKSDWLSPVGVAFDGAQYLIVYSPGYAGSYGIRVREADLKPLDTTANPNGFLIGGTTMSGVAFDGSRFLVPLAGMLLQPNGLFGKRVRPDDAVVEDGGPGGAGFTIDDGEALQPAVAGAGDGRTITAFAQGTQVLVRLIGDWGPGIDAGAPDGGDLADGGVIDAGGAVDVALDAAVAEGGPLVDGGVDASRPDGAAPATIDGAIAPDAGAASGSGGCGCRVGARGRASGWALLTALALAFRRRGRNRARPRRPVA
jgi:hypothetical protein